ncbi:hypothetical protein BCAR13_980019 [Paraburkholderia caribensis]|nr:hypothetical protein BCAR13_980019 [Paraburkholderia caribensis]
MGARNPLPGGGLREFGGCRKSSSGLTVSFNSPVEAERPGSRKQAKKIRAPARIFHRLSRTAATGAQPSEGGT